jgi:hypothetical protein
MNEFRRRLISRQDAFHFLDDESFSDRFRRSIDHKIQKRCRRTNRFLPSSPSRIWLRLQLRSAQNGGFQQLEEVEDSHRLHYDNVCSGLSRTFECRLWSGWIFHIRGKEESGFLAPALTVPKSTL